MDSGNFFIKFQEFLKENGKDFEDIDEALNAFVSQLEDFGEISEEQKRQIDSLELLEKAILENNRKKRGKYFKQALELWPDNIDAKVHLLEFANPFEYVKGLEEIWQIETAKELYLRPDPEYDLYRGVFWSFARHYGFTLFTYGMLAEAQEIYEYIYQIMGINIPDAVYELLTIYSLRQLWGPAMELYSNIGPLQEIDLAIVPLLILAILSRKHGEAQILNSRLEKVSTNLDNFIEAETGLFDEDLVLMMVNEYENSGQPNSMHSVGFALFPFMNYLNSMEYVSDWLANDRINKFFNPDAKVIPVTFNREQKIKKKPQSKSQHDNALYSPIFEGLQVRQVNILMDHGFKEAADFAKVPADDIATIPNIGPKTMWTLRQNGVKFLDD